MNKENRVLYDVGGYKYTVADVTKIYQKCKADIDKCDVNNLNFLYDFFHIRQENKFIQSTCEILGNLSERIAIIACSGDIKNIKKEVRNCRRKFYYWDDMPTYIYFINEMLDNYKTKRKFRADIKLHKKNYDNWIEQACYIVLLDRESVSDERIRDDKLYFHKLDWEYVQALRYFAGNYEISSDLEISIEKIFRDIYDRIRKYHPVSFYIRICKELYRRFDKTEKRIQINNEEKPELPTLLIYSVQALSEKNKDAEPYVRSTECVPDESDFQQLLVDTRYAITLLDVNNEHDMEFLLPCDESVYLERIMKYSSVYDIHQYAPEGMLFLIQRIIDAYSEQLERYYSCDADELRNIIYGLVRTAQCDFEAGRITKIPFEAVSGNERNILELMSATDSLNEEYYIPTQWDKVYSDSEWIIKTYNAYYVIPPIVSILGVYDKIGKALGWADFGTQIEMAVLDLFRGITGLKEYSGKYVFENRVCECDAIIMGTKYALIIECKRKGISRAARGGSDSNIVKDIAETYFASQSQAYRMQRAIELLGKKVDFYPSNCKISTNEAHNIIYAKDKTTADFTTVNQFIRISCTGGSFWIAGEGGIVTHIEEHIREYKVEGNKNEAYIDEFMSERDQLLAMKCCEHEKKRIESDKMFLSFDKLYDIVMESPRYKEGGDALLEYIWKLARIQSKKNDSMNHLMMFAGLDNSCM